MKPVVFVLGPTAVGKSEFAFKAAREWSGVILNCDSVQCYREVEIGAAKPPPGEREAVPHLLLDWISYPDELTAAVFRRRALEALAGESRPVFATGGSGFYLKALERGVFDVKPVSEERRLYWQDRAQAEGGAALHRELALRDPLHAGKVSANDIYRLVRALVLMESEGKSMTEIWAEFNSRPAPWPYRSVKIGLELPRDRMKERITARTVTMLESGWRAEVEKLLSKGYRDWAPLNSVGYKEMVQFLDGEIAQAELVPRIVQSTMRLAKKQMTWFKADPEIRWFESGAGFEAALSHLRAIDLGLGKSE